VRIEDITDIKLLITSFNWTRHCINLFHNFSPGGNPQVKLHEAVHVSSSPPYFFPPHAVTFDRHNHYQGSFISADDEEDCCCCMEEQGFQENISQESLVPGIYPMESGDFHSDGGMASNTPDVVLLGMAKKYWPEDEIHVLSIGTGHSAIDDKPHAPFSSSIIGLLKSNIFGTMIGASNEVNSMSCQLMCSTFPEKHQFLRVEMALPSNFDMSIVNFSPEHLEQLRKIGEQWFEVYKDQLKAFLDPFV